MSTRVDTAPLIAGSTVCGDQGLGVLGSVIRATTGTGTHGPGLLYDDWDSGDDGKEFRALIVTPPASGTLFAYEDGSFTLTGVADGTHSLTYRLFVDGADLGTATASFTVGSGFSVSPGGIASTNAFGVPSITRQQLFAASPSGIASAAAFGNAALTFSIGSTFSVSPAGIPSTNAFGNPTLSFSFPQTFALQVAGIASTVAFGAPNAAFDFPVLDEPVSVAQARSYIRFDGAELDADIAITITQAREQAEHITGRFYRRRVERVESESWPLGVTMLPFHEAAGVTIRYLSAADPDTWTELPSTVYRWSPQGFETRLQLRAGQAWPELAPSDYGVRVRVEVTVGLINPSTASASVRRYILASVAAWAEQPSAQRAGGTLGPNPLFEHLLDVERLWR
jgi:hypothetical protein